MMAPLTGGSGEEGTGWLQEKINWPKEIRCLGR